MRKTFTRSFATAAGIAVCGVMFTAPAQAALYNDPQTPGVQPVKKSKTVDAKKLLRKLDVAQERNAGYDRDEFNHWVDADKDGCDTRYEVLISESRKPVKIGSGCRLYSGLWWSVYDQTSTEAYTGFDVDHMVPLAEAYGSGASGWDDARREAYANDMGYPYSLVAVTAGSNRSKSDKEPGSWMPSNVGYACEYVSAWVAVKYRWGLTVDPAEKRSLASKLDSCAVGSRTIMKPKKAKGSASWANDAGNAIVDVVEDGWDAVKDWAKDKLPDFDAPNL